MKNMIFLALLMFTFACGKDEDYTPMKFSVMTYNVHHLMNAEGSTQEQIAELIRAEAPDVVLLQELDNGADRSGNVNQLSYLAEKAGYPYSHFSQTLELSPGTYGIGVLSKHPLVMTRDIALDVSESAVKSSAYYEQRNALFTSILFRGKIITLVNTHLHWEPEARKEQWVHLQRLLDKHTAANERVILSGDFNATPSELAGIDGFAMQGENPEGVDHFFTQNMPEPTSYTHTGGGLSDHYAFMLAWDI